MLQNNLNRKRKPRTPKNNPLNPNYEKLRARIMAKRERRQIKRITQGKNPIAHPLTMVSGVEQRRAYGRGNLLLLDGQTKVRVPLVTKTLSNEKQFLQGVYKLPTGEFVILRTTPFFELPALQYFILEKGVEKKVNSFFCRIEDIAHVFLKHPKMKGMGLGVKAASKAEKEYRATGGEQPIWVDGKLYPLYKKMHYRETESRKFMEKTGKTNPKDDMGKNHSIEAIDPITGKIKTYYFHIKQIKK